MVFPPIFWALVRAHGVRDATTGREMVRFDQLTSDICLE
jgi:hypothetical protein